MPRNYNRNERKFKAESQHNNNNNQNVAPNASTSNFIPVQPVVPEVVFGQDNDNSEKLVKQQIKFAIQDAEDYTINLDIENIAPSRREAVVNKLDALVKKFDQICAENVITDVQRKNIRAWKSKLEKKANDICFLDDDDDDYDEEEGDEEEDGDYSQNEYNNGYNNYNYW